MGLTRRARVEVDNSTIEYNVNGQLQVKDLGILTQKINDLAVTTVKLADNAVTTQKIAPEAVDGPHLAFDSVTETKIAFGAVTTAKIADGAVTTAKIANQAVDAFKLALPSVGSGHIYDRVITMRHLANIAPTKYALKTLAWAANKGLWIEMRYYAQLSTVTWSTDTHIRWYPIFPISNVQVTDIRINVTTASSAGGEVRLNIYDSNDDNYGISINNTNYGLPRTKLIGTDFTAGTATTGTKSVTLATPLSLDRQRIYWVGVQYNGVSTGPAFTSPSGGLTPYFGNDPAVFATNVHGFMTGTAPAYGTLPSDVSGQYSTLVYTAAIGLSVQHKITYLGS